MQPTSTTRKLFYATLILGFLSCLPIKVCAQGLIFSPGVKIGFAPIYNDADSSTTLRIVLGVELSALVGNSSGGPHPGFTFDLDYCPTNYWRAHLGGELPLLIGLDLGPSLLLRSGRLNAALDIGLYFPFLTDPPTPPRPLKSLSYFYYAHSFGFGAADVDDLGLYLKYYPKGVSADIGLD